MATGSTITSISSSRSPAISTSSTPGSPSMLSRSSRASRTSVRSGIGPDSCMTSMGSMREICISRTTGSSVSDGSSAVAVSTWARVSCRAFAVSTPEWNSSVRLAPPSKADALSSLRPSRERNSYSMGRTRSRSASSGEMPSWFMLTEMKGMLTSGSASLGMAP